MLANLTPPIFSESVDAAPGSAGFSPPADSAPVQLRRDAGEGAAEPSPVEAVGLLEEPQTWQQGHNEESRARLELIESHERRERELIARLAQAQQVIEAGRWELAQVQKLHEDQKLALNRQQAQHQNQLRQLQDSLAEARQEIERGQGDLQGLRQRCVLLEQDRDLRECSLSNLKIQLQAAREALGSRSTELVAAQQRCAELEQQHQQGERERAARVEALEQELQAAREELGNRSTELIAAQQRCDELEQQRQESESRCQGLRSELERQRDVRAAAEADHGSPFSDLETQRLRDELAAVQQLLEELPDIYEDKFRQRLQPLLEQRDWLLHENSWLRAELPAPRAGRPAALEPESEPADLAALAPRRGLLQSVRALLPFGRLGRRRQGSVRPKTDQNTDAGPGAAQPGREPLSSGPDDEPPTDASADPRRR